jgi:hypothetical protein
MSSAKDKMYNYEATPPASAWEAIATALDEPGPAAEYPSRLHDLEVTPPAGIWELISKSLDPVEVSKPRTRVLPIFLRYAAAAAVIAAVTFTVFSLVNSKPGKNEMASAIPTARDSGSNERNIVKAPVIDIPSNTLLTDDDHALEQSKKMLARLDHTPRLRSNKAAAIAASVYPGSGENITAPEFAYDDEVPDMADRYVMLMTPDGNFIRMSKKWSSLLCCVSGEEQDADCKDQLKKWQQKIAASPVTQSPGNFLDILGLVNSLDDEL